MMTAGKHGTERREVLAHSVSQSPNVKWNTLPFGWNWVSNLRCFLLMLREDRGRRKGIRRCLTFRPADSSPAARRRLPARRPQPWWADSTGAVGMPHTACLRFWRPRLFEAQVMCCIPSLSLSLSLSPPYAAPPPRRQPPETNGATCLSARHACNLQAYQPPHLFEFPAGGSWFGFMVLFSAYTYIVL